ncbi:MAG TPA: response regulator [Bryobacteraceae bacterium]|jgi:CheY-like chemotaxis protein
MTEGAAVVLLADDEPWLSEALAFSLESQGLECAIATDVSSAVQTLQSRRVLALVTDIMMPGGPEFPKVDASEAGFYLIDLVRRQWPKLPIVCLSVIGDQQKIRSLTARGIRYLRKGETPLSTAVDVITAVATGRRIRLH